MYQNKTYEKICQRSLISGRVQGASFLNDAQKRAIDFGLTGWIRYREDGRVETVCQGDRIVVEAMRYWLWQGSPDSQVESVETEGQDLKTFQSFEVRY